jgi:hypothetical protein
MSHIFITKVSEKLKDLLNLGQIIIQQSNMIVFLIFILLEAFDVMVHMLPDSNRIR